MLSWKNDKFWNGRKKTLTVTIVKGLLKGKHLVKGLYSEKTDKTYDAYVILDEWTGYDGKIRVGYKTEFLNKNK